jgi:hypothetical protein
LSLIASVKTIEYHGMMLTTVISLFTWTIDVLANQQTNIVLTVTTKNSKTVHVLSLLITSQITIEHLKPVTLH